MIAMNEVYHISLAQGYPLATVVIVFRDCAHRHRPGFDPGAGVVDPSTALRAGLVRGLHAEEVAFACLAHKRRLGLGGMRQAGAPARRPRSAGARPVAHG
jgi:hypothetical protein